MFAARDLEHLRTEVDAHHMTARTGELGELRRQLARTASDVERGTARGHARLACRAAPPAGAGARGQDGVDGVVAAGDPGQHRPDPLRGAVPPRGPPPWAPA